MIKTVQGVRCNTLTAKCLATYDSGDKASPKYYRETLYVNKFRNFFIHGEGNEESRYAVSSSGTYVPGEDIVALSYDDAKKWAITNLPKEEYTKLFYGDNALLSTTNEVTARTSLTLTKAARAKLTMLASRSGKSLSEVASELIMAAEI